MSPPVLTQFVGVYVLIVSLLFLLRQERFMEFAYDFIGNRSLRFTVSLFELMGGLALVLVHNVWVVGYEAIITVLGWMLVIESLFFLTASEAQCEQLLRLLDRKLFLYGYSLMAVIIGTYLTAIGFGMI